MLICWSAEEVHGQAKVGSLRSKQYLVTSAKSPESKYN